MENARIYSTVCLTMSLCHYAEVFFDIGVFAHLVFFDFYNRLFVSLIIPCLCAKCNRYHTVMVFSVMDQDHCCNVFNSILSIFIDIADSLML